MAPAGWQRTSVKPLASSSSPPNRGAPGRRTTSAPSTRMAGEAARLYKLAAEQGVPEAQASLGVFYENGGGGLAKDEREAARLYKLAADQGDAAAQNNLGDFYKEGRGGLAKDDQEAARLFKLAAEQGAP